jgi:NTP pyrophosphatase (non-canonical NTP hydrolase)
MLLHEEKLQQQVSKILDIPVEQMMQTPFVILIGKLVRKIEGIEHQMKMNEYQDLTSRTAPHFDDIVEEIVAWSMGLAGETGEYCDLVKKAIWHKHDWDHRKQALELGDILYYISRSANAIGYTMDEIATMNIIKLNERYPNGFNPNDSKNRKV